MTSAVPVFGLRGGLAQLYSSATDQPFFNIDVPLTIGADAVGAVELSGLQQVGGDYIARGILVVGPAVHITNWEIVSQEADQLVVDVSDGQTGPQSSYHQEASVDREAAGRCERPGPVDTFVLSVQAVYLHPAIGPVGHI